MQGAKLKKIQPILIYGQHPVMAACSNSRRQIKQLYTTASNFSQNNEALFNVKAVTKVSNHWFNQKLPGVNHQQLAALVTPLSQPSMQQLNLSYDKQFVILLDNITDPHNIGAITRSAAAFGASAVITTKHNSPSETASMVRTAAGGFECMPYVQVTNLQQAVTYLKDHGFWICGLAANTNNNLEITNKYHKLALVLGSEDKGLRPSTTKACDLICKINMPGINNCHLDSLNVAACGAIAMHTVSNNFTA
ncbi:MAG: 23S rRNA (guanosine(2251)-2'-O)-methyltransferase RlmB [Pseudomonadota bacterium]